jgi:hypothetical protein
VIIRDAECVELAQVASVVSDFDCTWLRFDGINSTPREILTLGGQRLQFEGHQILELPERVAYSWLTKDAEQGIYVRN